MRSSAIALFLLAACGTDPADIANQVKAWAGDGIKGEVGFDSVSCQQVGEGQFSCKGEVTGGGSVTVSARKTDGGWEMALAEPIVVSSLVEELLEKRLTELDLGGHAVECGERVRPATPGGSFKCAVEEPGGAVVNAAHVTIKDEAGNIDADWVTPLIPSSEVEEKIAGWLASQEITGKVDCGPRHRFSKPGTKFQCSVEGEPRKVVVTMNDFRGNLSLAFEGS